MGEVTCGGSPHLTRKRDQIKMREYLDRRVTPPKRVTSPTWGPLPPCKQTLTIVIPKQGSWVVLSLQTNNQSECDTSFRTCEMSIYKYAK